jgi:hypothetical protein
VPHGGSLVAGSIPDRTSNSPVFAKDGLTIETALEIVIGQVFLMEVIKKIA